MAAAAAFRVSRAAALLASRSHELVRGIPKMETRGPRVFVKARAYCAIPKDRTTASSAEKIEEILEILKSRGGCSTEEFQKLPEIVSNLQARVYYGGILFGALSAAALTFPAMVHDIQKTSAKEKTKRQRTDNQVNSMEQRLKAVEDALKMKKEEVSTETLEGIQGSEELCPSEETSWLFKVLSYVKVL